MHLLFKLLYFKLLQACLVRAENCFWCRAKRKNSPVFVHVVKFTAWTVRFTEGFHKLFTLEEHFKNPRAVLWTSGVRSYCTSHIKSNIHIIQIILANLITQRNVDCPVEVLCATSCMCSINASSSLQSNMKSCDITLLKTDISPKRFKPFEMEVWTRCGQAEVVYRVLLLDLCHLHL